MTQANLPSPSLFSRAKRIETVVQTAFFLFKHDHADSAALLASQAADKAAALLEELKTSDEDIRAYVEKISGSKFTNFEDHQKGLARLSLKTDWTETDEQELEGLLHALRAHVGVLMEETGKIDRAGRRASWPRFHFSVRVLAGLGLTTAILAAAAFYFLKPETRGLTGSYYLGTNLEDFFQARVDPVIDFSWGRKSPLAGFPADEFSIRWEGFLDIREEGEITFSTISDDGVRLFIDGKEVLANWTRHHPEVDKATLKLEEGYHPIRLEYFEKFLDATIALRWQREGEDAWQPIPSAYLIPRRDLLKADRPLHEK